MSNTCKVITNFNNISPFANRTETIVGEAITKGVFDIEARAKANIVANGQVDTGAMLSSVQGQMLSDRSGEVAVGVEYGAPQELGYRGVAGRPFLGPAFTETVPEVQAFLQEALNSYGPSNA